MTLAEGFDRKKIESLLRGAFPKLETHTYQDVVHATPDREDPACPDVFFFDVRVFCQACAGCRQLVQAVAAYLTHLVACQPPPTTALLIVCILAPTHPSPPGSPTVSVWHGGVLGN